MFKFDFNSIDRDIAKQVAKEIAMVFGLFFGLIFVTFIMIWLLGVFGIFLTMILLFGGIMAKFRYEDLKIDKKYKKEFRKP